MPSLKLTALAAASILAFASAQSMQLVEAPFNATAYNSFISCIEAVGDNYDVAIDEGRTIILPVEGETIDLDNEDAALATCMHEGALHTKVGIDGGRDIIPELPFVPINEASADWAQYHGAMGMTSQESGVQARSDELFARGGTLAARATAPLGYYFAHGSVEDDKCEHIGQVSTHTGSCQSQMNAYKSIKFSNPDKTHAIKATIWPHHNCAQDPKYGGKDGRAVSVPANHYSACQEKRTTYSWYGVYA